MPAKINGLIPPRKLEVIRDKVAEVLAVEIAKQYTLSNTYPNVQKVWLERFIPFDAGTECPAINVNFAKADLRQQNPKRKEHTVTINVDVYTIGIPQNHGEYGDKIAMMQMVKLMGMVDAILCAPVYATLGLPAGYISHVQVSRMYVGDKQNSPDALASVVGRVILEVTCQEDYELTGTVALEQNNTHIKLGESDAGFYLETTTT